MKNHDIQKQIEAADRAINNKDLSTIPAFYTESAALVVRPGKIVNGREDILKAYHRIADYFNDSLAVSQGDMVIIEAGDTALVLAKTFVASPDKLDSQYPQERDAIYVYRKNKKGEWLCAIDNSYGVDLLNEKHQNPLP